MFHVELFLSSVLPLARSRPKAFFFSSGSAKEISPACLAGKGPFAQFPVKHLPMFHVELFHRSCLFSSVMPLVFCRPKAFFFSSGSAKAINPALPTGRAPFASFPPAIMQMFHVELFSSVMPLALCGPKAFSPARPKQSVRLVRRRDDLLPDYTPKTHPNVPHGTFFTFQNGKKPGFVRFACFHPPASVL